VIRGGSWNNDPANVRCANRNNNDPANRNNNLGVRLASTGERQHPRPLRWSGPSIPCPGPVSRIPPPGGI